MENLLIGLARYTDQQRKEIKLLVLLFALHFAGLILGQFLIQFAVGTILHPANGIFGIVWMAGAIFMVWCFGGCALDALLLVYTTTDWRVSTTLVRILIGFFTVESFVNICFGVVPFYANSGAFFLVAMAAASYFMFKHMDRQGVSWGSWIWFPVANMAIGVASCIWAVLPPIPW